MNSTTNTTDKPVAVQPAQADTCVVTVVSTDKPVPKKRYKSMYDDIWNTSYPGKIHGFDNWSKAHSFYIMARRKWGSLAQWRGYDEETKKPFNVYYAKENDHIQKVGKIKSSKKQNCK